MAEIALMTNPISKLDLLANITETLLVGIRYKATKWLLFLLINPLFDLLDLSRQAPIKEKRLVS